MKHCAAALAALASALALPAPAQPGSAAEAAGWREVSAVLRHPRCMNCHTVTEFPRQGDDRHRHQQRVMRGPKGTGAATLQCSACHQSSNSHDGTVPGAPNWHLAPLSMGWENLNEAQLCSALKDRTKNGDRDPAALAEHMTRDALVQWAWAPGARAAPPLGQSAFHAAVQRWVAGGAPCPD